MQQRSRRAPASPTRRAWLIVAPLLLVLASACGGPWIRVQNVGSVPANVTITYYDSAGNTVAQDSREVAPGAATNFSATSNDQVPRGYKGSAVIESDQPVVALRRTDRTGNTTDMLDGDTLSMAAGGSNLFLPLVLNHAGPFNSWTSQINLQNLSDTATACVTITYINRQGGKEVAWDPYKPKSKTPAISGCPKGGRPLAPLATLVRDADSFGVPSGFAGAVRIDTTDNGVQPTQQPIILATVDTWNNAFNSLTSYRAFPESEMDTTVLLPLIERDVGPDSSYRTYFHIQSKDASKSVQVQLHYEGVDGNGQFVSKSNSLTFSGATICDQVADDATNCLAPGDTLPPGFSGWASLVATAPIAVIVERGSYLRDFGNYRGLGDSHGGTRVALPAIKDNSWLRILAADRGGANVRIHYFGPQLNGGEAFSQVFPVSGVGTIFQSDEAALPAGFDGSAILESDAPIVAVAAYDVGGGGDHTMLYGGVPIP